MREGEVTGSNPTGARNLCENDGTYWGMAAGLARWWPKKVNCYGFWPSFNHDKNTLPSVFFFAHGKGLFESPIKNICKTLPTVTLSKAFAEGILGFTKSSSDERNPCVFLVMV